MANAIDAADAAAEAIARMVEQARLTDKKKWWGLDGPTT